jgi:ribonuclease R
VKKKAIEEKILSILAADSRKLYKTRELFRKAGVANSEYPEFKVLLREMADSGGISRGKGGRYGKAQPRNLLEGTLHVKTQGFGFLVREDGSEDIFISQRNMGSALHRDRVRVEVWARPMGRLPEGRVVEVLERGRERIVGLFHQAGSYQAVIPDELKITRDILIPEGMESEAKPGHKVVVEVSDWGDERRMPEGRICEVLGYPQEKGVDVLSVIHGYDLPVSFPEVVETEAARIETSSADRDLSSRTDIRDRLVFTIDPEDAKDHDDAVSLERISGGWLLGVHIADVSHFVRTGSSVDLEALKRGTSVYLVDRVIPMLPEKLSNNVCSLVPDADRLTYSVFMEISADGSLEDYRIEETVIRSRYKLSYHDVHRVLSGDGAERAKYPADVVRNMEDMQALSAVLFKKWRKSGSMDFDAPEPRVILDENGRPCGLGIRERFESHRIIESFMLMANRTVAEHVQKLRDQTGTGRRFVYRVHEKPSGKKLETFLRFVRAMGHDFDPGDKITPGKFQRFLEQVKGTRHETVIEEMALRTMMKAVYTTQNAGHFGLAFKHYTHFTSPIRRYPDLVVHRLLKSFGRGDGNPEFAAPLSRICETATDREIAAAEAERESVLAKQLEYMEQRLGEEYEAVISGVVAFGFFAEITDFMVEGLVHVQDLKDDYYAFDEDRYRLVGSRTGRIFQLGDTVRVRVAKVLRDMRKIDFVLSDIDLSGRAVASGKVMQEEAGKERHAGRRVKSAAGPKVRHPGKRKAGRTDKLKRRGNERKQGKRPGGKKRR